MFLLRTFFFLYKKPSAHFPSAENVSSLGRSKLHLQRLKSSSARQYGRNQMAK